MRADDKVRHRSSAHRKRTGSRGRTRLYSGRSIVCSHGGTELDSSTCTRRPRSVSGNFIEHHTLHARAVPGRGARQAAAQRFPRRPHLRLRGRDDLDVYGEQQQDEHVLHHRDAHDEAAEGPAAVHLPEHGDHARRGAGDAERRGEGRDAEHPPPGRPGEEADAGRDEEEDGEDEHPRADADGCREAEDERGEVLGWGGGAGE